MFSFDLFLGGMLCYVAKFSKNIFSPSGPPHPGVLPLRAPAALAPPPRHRQVRGRLKAGAPGLPAAADAEEHLAGGAPAPEGQALQVRHLLCVPLKRGELWKILR